ncbi:MAG TPA: YlxR family protein [Syntrophomonadaceae bacterium]|nr:YlxR family protein [Syntrophomonadaceae bacterium]
MAKSRKVPQRMCVGCKEMKIKKELIRIVRNTEGILEIDTTGKKSGRGAYICPNLDCFDQAVKVRGIQKALGQKLPNELQNDLKKQIEKIRSNI